MKKKYKKIDVREAAERLYKEPAEMKNLIKEFLNDDILEKAEKAFAENNLEEARLEMHTIRGAATNIGLPGLGKLAFKIEKKIKEDEYLDFKLLKLMRKIWDELKDERGD